MAAILSTLLLASLVSTCYAQFNDGFNNNGGWRGSYSAGIVIAAIVAIMLLLSCCMISRRRRFARSTNPSVKPPLFGTAPPGYSLPFWNNSNQRVQPAQYGNGYAVGGTGTNASGHQYPPPPTQAPSDPPPPPYGKAGEQTETYAPPLGPPPQAHVAGETSHFVGGFRQQQS